MSGKASGKKRNRAAQSEQHGFQQPPSEKAAGAKDVSDKPDLNVASNKKRLLEKLQELNRERIELEGSEEE